MTSFTNVYGSRQQPQPRSSVQSVEQQHHSSLTSSSARSFNSLATLPKFGESSSLTGGPSSNDSPYSSLYSFYTGPVGSLSVSNANTTSVLSPTTTNNISTNFNNHHNNNNNLLPSPKSVYNVSHMSPSATYWLYSLASPQQQSVSPHLINGQNNLLKLGKFIIFKFYNFIVLRACGRLCEMTRRGKTNKANNLEIRERERDVDHMPQFISLRQLSK